MSKDKTLIYNTEHSFHTLSELIIKLKESRDMLEGSSIVTFQEAKDWLSGLHQISDELVTLKRNVVDHSLFKIDECQAEKLHELIMSSLGSPSVEDVGNILNGKTSIDNKEYNM